MNVLGMPRDEVCCRMCSEHATQFVVIKRLQIPVNDKLKTIEATIGFFCDEHASEYEAVMKAAEQKH